MKMNTKLDTNVDSTEYILQTADFSHFDVYRGREYYVALYQMFDGTSQWQVVPNRSIDVEILADNFNDALDILIEKRQEYFSKKEVILAEKVWI